MIGKYTRSTGTTIEGTFTSEGYDGEYIFGYFVSPTEVYYCTEIWEKDVRISSEGHPYCPSVEEEPTTDTETEEDDGSTDSSEDSSSTDVTESEDDTSPVVDD